MKRVKIIGFSAAERCGVGYTSIVRKEFFKCGMEFPVLGLVDESKDDLFIDEDPAPWAASTFVYEEVTPTPTTPS